MKRLYRSRTHRVIGGVAGGIGEYLDIDPVLARILFILALFAGGAGLLAYIIAWIIIPEQPRESTMTIPPDSQQPNMPPQPQQPSKPEEAPRRGSIIGGLVLLVLGLLFLGQNFLPDFDFGDWWPLILVAIGVGLLYKALRPSHS
ncbi:MAG: putative stress-responsive transcriptional regulator [Bacteroidetes bacterium]|nr:putative stress-responsive transcriptional regulator [Bacteroidota bacterium]